MKALRLLVVSMLAAGWWSWTLSGSVAQTLHAMPAPDQFAPYVTADGDATYGLSQREVQGLLTSRGMGQAHPAEMNGYPGPLHVLELADELALTPEQKQQARAARERVVTEAPELGRQIVEKELALDRLFRDRSADAARIDALTQEISRLRAVLRVIHLRAHLVMQRTLAVEQVRTYMAARSHAAPSQLRPNIP